MDTNNIKLLFHQYNKDMFQDLLIEYGNTNN